MEDVDGHKINSWLLVLGALLAICAVSATDCRFIVGFGAVSVILMFFSFEVNRNPKRLKRLWMLAKKGHPQW